MILNRNPAAVTGKYKLSGVKGKIKTCRFEEWKLAMEYGPEKFNKIPVSLKFVRKKYAVPKTATHIMFINNGLTDIKLDDTNLGTGFNLNLLCFILKKNGKQGCYNL